METAPDRIIVEKRTGTGTPRILVIAPHADDEVLGCGGMLSKMSDGGAYIELIVCGMGWAGTLSTRLNELDRAADVLGIHKYTVLYPRKEQALDTVPQHHLIAVLDAFLEQEYDEVYYPCPGQHHQDHRAVEQACVAALRPSAHATTPSIVATYENTYTNWHHARRIGGTMYVDISDYIDRKCQALLCYKSQLGKGGPNHPISIRGIRALAALRGIESGYKFAELYHITRIRREKWH